MLITILTFLVGLIGASLVATGAWLVTPAAGLITGGVICLFWSFLAARAASGGAPRTGGE